MQTKSFQSEVKYDNFPTEHYIGKLENKVKKKKSKRKVVRYDLPNNHK